MKSFIKFKSKFGKLLCEFGLSYKIRLYGLKLCKHTVGKNTYIGTGLLVTSPLLGDQGSRLIIGDRVAIAPRVTIILASNANYSKYKKLFPRRKGDVIIEDDAWIGAGVIIYNNVRIGEGSLVAAGSVVTKDVEPFTFVAGVPAKQIKKFDFNRDSV